MVLRVTNVWVDHILDFTSKLRSLVFWIFCLYGNPVQIWLFAKSCNAWKTNWKTHSALIISVRIPRCFNFIFRNSNVAAGRSAWKGIFGWNIKTPFEYEYYPGCWRRAKVANAVTPFTCKDIYSDFMTHSEKYVLEYEQ